MTLTQRLCWITDTSATFTDIPTSKHALAQPCRKVDVGEEGDGRANDEEAGLRSERWLVAMVIQPSVHTPADGKNLGVLCCGLARLEPVGQQLKAFDGHGHCQLIR